MRFMKTKEGNFRDDASTKGKRTFEDRRKVQGWNYRRNGRVRTTLGGHRSPDPDAVERVTEH